VAVVVEIAGREEEALAHGRTDFGPVEEALRRRVLEEGEAWRRQEEAEIHAAVAPVGVGAWDIRSW